VRGGDVGVDMRTLKGRKIRLLRLSAANTSAKRTRRAPRRGRAGTALVELAIVMPILCLLTLGLMEYGWVFLKVSQINQAARQGVRVAVRPDATTEDVKAAVAAMMTQAGIRSTQYTLTYTNIGVAVGQPITVQVSVIYNKITLTGTGLVPLPDKIQGRGTMSKEGPSTTAPASP
jgi:Flp pilus assembly protein TadG